MAVYPDPELLTKLGALPLQARQAMLGSVSGNHRSPVRGSSLEFAEYRKYIPGDDLRRLDWRAWGRSDRYYIKEFEADTNLRLVFLIDTSGSMGYSDGGESKLEKAKQLASALAYLTSHQGDAVGLYSSGPNGIETSFPAKRGGANLAVFLDELKKLQPKGETGLAQSIHEVAEIVSQRALVIVISDLFFDPVELKDAFQHLTFRKHDGAVFHLIDQKETDFKFDRPTKFIDLEGNPSLLVDPALIKSRYQTAIDQYLTSVSDTVRDANIDYHRIGFQTKDEEALSNFLLGRAQTKK